MRLRVGVSQCLLGENVRWDGGHKRDRFVTDVLGPFVELVPVCPELELGLGVPREPIRLERRGRGLALVGVESGADHTEKMARWSKDRVAALGALDLCGYILKAKSPSCGMERVAVHEGARAPKQIGVGLFAKALLSGLPDLPVAEEGRLSDPRLRESFIERLFAYRRVTDLFASEWRTGDLVAFHAREKLLLLAHEPAAYTELGRLVANARKSAALAASYRSTYSKALAKPATSKGHVNVLRHMASSFEKQLPADEKAELAGAIEDYRRGLVPLVVPITLLRHHVRRFDVKDLADQVYLQPHPSELLLRNHV